MGGYYFARIGQPAIINFECFFCHMNLISAIRIPQKCGQISMCFSFVPKCRGKEPQFLFYKGIFYENSVSISLYEIR